MRDNKNTNKQIVNVVISDLLRRKKRKRSNNKSVNGGNNNVISVNNGGYIPLNPLNRGGDMGNSTSFANALASNLGSPENAPINTGYVPSPDVIVSNTNPNVPIMPYFQDMDAQNQANTQDQLQRSLEQQINELRTRMQMFEERGQSATAEVMRQELQSMGVQTDNPMMSAEHAQRSVEGQSQTNNPMMVEGGSQTNNPMMVEGGSQTNNPMMVEGGSQTNNPMMVEGGSQTNNPMMVDTGVNPMYNLENKVKKYASEWLQKELKFREANKPTSSDATTSPLKEKDPDKLHSPPVVTERKPKKASFMDVVDQLSTAFKDKLKVKTPKKTEPEDLELQDIPSTSQQPPGTVTRKLEFSPDRPQVFTQQDLDLYQQYLPFAQGAFDARKLNKKDKEGMYEYAAYIQEKIQNNLPKDEVPLFAEKIRKAPLWKDMFAIYNDYIKKISRNNV